MFIVIPDYNYEVLPCSKCTLACKQVDKRPCNCNTDRYNYLVYCCWDCDIIKAVKQDLVMRPYLQVSVDQFRQSYCGKCVEAYKQTYTFRQADMDFIHLYCALACPKDIALREDLLQTNPPLLRMLNERKKTQ